MKTYTCGCVNDTDPVTGADFSVAKCDHHKSKMRECGELGADYYQELGALSNDAGPRYIAEFLDGFGPVPPAPSSRSLAIELGCGCSSYVPLFRDAGYRYHAFDSSRWAVEWMNTRHGDRTASVAEFGNISAITLPESADIVLCAHALEHVRRPLETLSMIRDMLVPGGLLLLLIPDDTDAVNPDHLFFFSQDALRRSLVRAGFVVEAMTIRKRVAHENFIYATARVAE